MTTEAQIKAINEAGSEYLAAVSVAAQRYYAAVERIHTEPNRSGPEPEVITRPAKRNRGQKHCGKCGKTDHNSRTCKRGRT